MNSCAMLAAVMMGFLATPACGQAVTFADLDGHVIEARFVREQENRRDGKTFSVTVRQNWMVSIGPEKAITFTVRSRVQGPRRVRDMGPLSGSYTLDETREVETQGGGNAIWTFADETLTFIRTYRAGARRITFAFERGPDGLTCTAGFAFAREDGSGPLRLKGLASGRDTEIVQARLVSSTCRVAKKDPAPPPGSDGMRP